jgi:hypothetical protein
LRAFGGAELAAMPRVEISEAAAPAITAVEKVRLFIIMICLPSMDNVATVTEPRRKTNSSSQ